MGNQCCSQNPCESNQLLTTTGREIRKSDTDLASKRKLEVFRENGQDIDQDDSSNPQKQNNVYETNQDEHFPAKTIAIEIDRLPPNENDGKKTLFLYVLSFLKNYQLQTKHIRN